MNALFNAASTSQTQHLDDVSPFTDELPVELQPKFTAQDEQRELATLTIQELTELQRDLTGIQNITNGFSGLGLAKGATESTTSTTGSSHGEMTR